MFLLLSSLVCLLLSFITMFFLLTLSLHFVHSFTHLLSMKYAPDLTLCYGNRRMIKSILPCILRSGFGLECTNKPTFVAHSNDHCWLTSWWFTRTTHFSSISLFFFNLIAAVSFFLPPSLLSSFPLSSSLTLFPFFLSFYSFFLRWINSGDLMHSMAIIW